MRTAAVGPPRSAGYEASVEYVVSTLRADGYDVSTPTYDGSDGQDSPDVTLRNVIAQTKSGDSESIVMIGAHLDSVETGPGIVDDGSGVAVLLEIAHQLGATASIRHGVRFAFFGSEENGARGSPAYVTASQQTTAGKIWLYLNVDMVASPNAGYFVQGGKGDDESASGPPGSAAVARVLADQLTITGVTPRSSSSWAMTKRRSSRRTFRLRVRRTVIARRRTRSRPWPGAVRPERCTTRAITRPVIAWTT